MERNQIYEDIACRTGGDIYIGVVGPVRTGKSTFIKRFMETMVIPNINNVYRRERARDELPQSGSGRTIMTAEPKFVPEEAVELQMEDGATFSVRLIDSVGYLVPGAVGQMEEDLPRMVTTPWFDYEIPMSEAAEVGTRKVISEHSTIGIVVTTDGSISEIPREDYLEAEARVIQELQELGKPFLVLLNSKHPGDAHTQAMASDIASRLRGHLHAYRLPESLSGGHHVHHPGRPVRVPHQGVGAVPSVLGGRSAPRAPHQGRPLRRHPGEQRPAPPAAPGADGHRPDRVSADCIDRTDIRAIRLGTGVAMVELSVPGACSTRPSASSPAWR